MVSVNCDCAVLWVQTRDDQNPMYIFITYLGVVAVSVSVLVWSLKSINTEESQYVLSY